MLVHPSVAAVGGGAHINNNDSILRNLTYYQKVSVASRHYLCYYVFHNYLRHGSKVSRITCRCLVTAAGLI